MHISFLFFICGIALPLFLIFTGIRFGIKLKFFYILHPVRSLKAILGGKGGFKALSLALAGTLGIGNIVGVSSALQWGGSGALFWMVISSVIAMSVKYAETFFSVKYRHFNGKSYTGGAPFYIIRAIKGKKAPFFASVFALMCLINSLITGNMVQMNGIKGVLSLSPVVTGIVFATAFFVIILKGVDKLSSFTSVVIPTLTLLHLFISLFIIMSNFGNIGYIVTDIISEAFNIKGAVCGVGAYSIMSSVRYGVSRGILSNEAGCGTSPIAHAECENTPHVQGCLGIFEVLIDTSILCTVTGAVILLYGIDTHVSPIELVCLSYGAFVGRTGYLFIKLSCIMYALSTLLSQFYYGEKSLAYLSRKRIYHLIYLTVFVFVCIISPSLSSDSVWIVSDLNIAFLTFFNLTVLNLLLNDIKIHN